MRHTFPYKLHFNPLPPLNLAFPIQLFTNWRRSFRSSRRNLLLAKKVLSNTTIIIRLTFATQPSQVMTHFQYSSIVLARVSVRLNCKCPCLIPPPPSLACLPACLPVPVAIFAETWHSNRAVKMSTGNGVVAYFNCGSIDRLTVEMVEFLLFLYFDPLWKTDRHRTMSTWLREWIWKFVIYCRWRRERDTKLFFSAKVRGNWYYFGGQQTESNYLLSPMIPTPLISML